MPEANQFIGEQALTLPEIADMLQVTQAAVRNWVREGRLVSERMPNGRRIVQRSDLERMLDDNPRLGKPKPRGDKPARAPRREDWSEAPEEAALDLASSTGF